MTRKSKSGKYRIDSRNYNPETHKRKNPGTVLSWEAAKNRKEKSSLLKEPD